jgi:hypothetical protein
MQIANRTDSRPMFSAGVKTFSLPDEFLDFDDRLEWLSAKEQSGLREIAQASTSGKDGRWTAGRATDPPQREVPILLLRSDASQF